MAMKELKGVKMGIEYKIKCLKVITARIECEGFKLRKTLSALAYDVDTDVNTDYVQLLLNLRKKFFRGTMDSVAKLTANEEKLLENICKEVDDAEKEVDDAENN